MPSEESLRGEQLLDTLEYLRKALNNSGVERTVGLKESMGSNCPFYWKSMALFVQRDYDIVKRLVLEAAKLLGQTEEENILNS